MKLQRSEYGRIIDAAKPPSPLERLATVARSVVGDAAFDDARRQTGSNESHFAMAALASQLLLGEKPDESQWTGRAGKALQDRLVDKMVAELG